MARQTLYFALLAISAPWLYDRYLAFSPLLANRPGVFQDVYGIKSHEFKFRDQIRNCEDVVLEEGMGLAFLTCDPGRDTWNTVMGTFKPEKRWENGAIYIYDYSTPGISDEEALKKVTLENFPNAEDFHPLGMEYEKDTSTLYVINHAREASVIEIFKVSPSTATATHVKTFKHPLVYAPNAIHTLGDGKLFITIDHFFQARDYLLLSKLETFSGAPGGTVVYIDINKPETAKIVARVPFANGVAMINSTTLAVASSGKPGIYFYEVTPSYDLNSKSYIRTPSSVDNISVDGNGKILMAGHPYAINLLATAEQRVNCVPGSENEEEQKACGCIAPSWAAEWSQEGGLKELYKGSEYCSSSIAVRDTTRGIGMISGLYDRGIMVFKE